MNTLKVKNEIQSSIDVKVSLLTDDALVGQILDLAERCSNSLRSGGKIIFCGNGGSFADAQHLSAEFTSRFLFDRESLASIALGTNNSAITAIGNDYGYENVFSREIQSIGNRRDILIPITTSGNSANILRVIEVAEQKENRERGKETSFQKQKTSKYCFLFIRLQALSSMRYLAHRLQLLSGLVTGTPLSCPFHQRPCQNPLKTWLRKL